ncbi:CBS domain-containing protein [Lysobacter niabensis]|uniref:CBS domain-containing protein n=1 Tax=Agrilutibacter niabensis TaxID=380628 RepID=UPI00361E0183
MTVVSVMTPNPACCTTATPLRDVARMMRDNDCGQIPVVDESQRPVGVVTDRDIAMRVVAEGRNSNEATAADAMSKPVRTVTTDTSLTDCVCLMEAEQVRRVPVVDAEGRLAGIVSIADLALAGKQEATAEVVREVSEPSSTRH